MTRLCVATMAAVLACGSAFAQGRLPTPALNTPTITGGTISGATITESAGAFTTLSASGAVSGAGINALLAPYAPLASPTFTGNTTVGGALVTPLIQAPSATTQIVVKNAASGSLLMLMGGVSNDIQPMTNIKLPGGTWGSGALANNLGPIFQNATFAGTTASTAVGFGAFLQQTDNSSTGGGQAWGFLEHLIMNGASATGTRTAGQFNLDIVATGNTTRQQHVGLGSKCNLMTSEGSSNSSCFGENPVGHIGPGVTAETVVGGEANTWIEAGATVRDKFGWAVVDTNGSIQATTDNIGLTINNQYAPTSTLGYTVGIEFGKTSGYFPISTTGTLIYGQGIGGATWTVANGIDWHLGTATGNWLNLGGVFTVGGSGLVTLAGMNGWPTSFALVPGGTSVSAGGTGNAVGDVLTLVDGCATHATIVVTAVSTGAVTAYNLASPGSCAATPANPVAVGSTTGTGTGATFTTAWAPNIAGGGRLVLGTLANNNGNTFIGSELSPNFAGSEGTFIGDRAGGNMVSGYAVLAIGHNACGIGAGVPITNADKMMCIGTDAGRNIAQGVTRDIIIGNASAENMAGVDNVIIGSGIGTTGITTAAQNTLINGGTSLTTGRGNVVIGSQADINAGNVANSVVIGSNTLGGQAGAQGGSNSVVIGAVAGNGALTGTRTVIIGPNVANTTCAGASLTILIGVDNTVDCTGANLNNWVNVGGAVLQSTIAPGISSGFGTSPSIPKGRSTAAFEVNVGTGGTATTGVISIPAGSAGAPNGWACSAVDKTNSASFDTIASGSTPLTVTLTNYSRTSGLVTAWTASDVIVVNCSGY